MREASANRGTSRYQRSACSSLDRDAVDLEMPAAQQRAGTDKRARRVVLAEMGFVHVVEFRVQRDVGAENMDEDKDVHGHAVFDEDGLQAVERDADFLLDIVGQLAGLGIKTESAGDVERVPDQHAIAEGRLDDLGQVDVTPGGFGTGI